MAAIVRMAERSREQATPPHHRRGGPAQGDLQLRMSTPGGPTSGGEPVPHTWDERVPRAVETMRKMVSRLKDPQDVIRAYAKRMLDWFFPTDGHVSLSRPGLKHPFYRITPQQPLVRRDQSLEAARGPLPLLTGGILADLTWSDNRALIDDLAPFRDDPAFEYLRGHSLPHR